ncbi:16S rRNA (guanine(527)-N(7))-methyltransferase RsmG [Treponema denticola]|uniref:Ribosomal RNA small subunit methyltransferase G n=1 Tax=Treponema denticola (strain ATCC 35405 / DSM 14222 / CIP 103919 / JCM 8153 / KCTC 15104) TaxID=243275 RepID=RSMG_TREDE|nr:MULTISPECIES: 16S rRNA (guanine(527)-N(7))-methyltransferase RsmG [Treponema]Q73JU8.1 RecName: Full=Ribosomal RNA small subunit methyltransferase G; AltName: Full=16S rRNA 7-methylguanosine methyltransferase; Short=16S rRNA m7G methyltransferase [Treponema denticola ATCC 35405]AAS13030.1 glucose-inhibited division protein B [Treponema denticola ATCC 35405]HCY94205.1 16S rRNA (guanine(527)-N(7))-methyltransferase RsmG [Treponema sp.]
MDTDKLLSKDLLSNGILLKGLKELGINEKAHNKLSKLLNIYMRELKMFNASFNLVKVKDDEELIVAHILDSLSAWRFFYNETKNTESKTSLNNAETKNTNEALLTSEPFYIADAGTGAGFPGVPLAALFISLGNLDVKLSLIERMQKRCTFLENIKAVLQLNNTEIIESEAEKAPQNKFDIVTCRAFHTLDKHILQTLLNLAKPKGKLFLYKAAKEKINEETELIKKEGLNYKTEKLDVPFLKKERHLLIIEKP